MDPTQIFFHIFAGRSAKDEEGYEVKIVNPAIMWDFAIALFNG